MAASHLKWIEIDASAIRSNARWVASRLSPGVRLMAVVKAGGYGHGAAMAARAALAGGASCVGALTAAEAAELRAAGIKAPIQLLSPVLPHDVGQAIKLNVIATIDSVIQARALNRAATPKGVAVHLDLDFGLGRWGARPQDIDGLLRGLRRLPRLRLAGLSTHIDYVPGKNSVEAEEKLSAFSKILQRLKKSRPGLVGHAANSSVLMDFPHWQLDLVRVGNLLYGINPAASKAAPLKKAWKFYARIIALKKVGRGQSIGYASEYVAPRAMRVATLAAGYSDGLTMEPAERLIGFGSGFQYWGMLKGRKTPFVGRCGISHVLVDVTDVPSAKVGDPVALPLRRTAAGAQLPRVYR